MKLWQKAHDLATRLALRIEVRAAFAAAHGQTGEAVLEGLLEGQELEDALGHARVEAEASLVRADRIVVLHAPSALHADVPVVVLPADAEAHHAVRLGDTPQDLRVVVDLLVGDVLEDIARHLVDGLLELCLSGITPLQALHELLEIDVVRYGHGIPPQGGPNGTPAREWDDEQPF